MSVLAALAEAAGVVRGRTTVAPTVGVVLGSGLGAWADTLGSLVAIPYQDIPHMPCSTVVGHAGRLCVGLDGGVAIACLKGRVHLYEGHTPQRVVFGVQLLAQLGCRAVVLTNAAGGIDAAFSAGDLMLITDHLNFMGQNPLFGANEDAIGPRFPDMTDAYDAEIAALAREAAKESSGPLREGVYVGMLGPNYETPAEIRMLRTLGASAVGMSTVPEVIALRHMGVRVGAVSCITNLAAGLSQTKLDHREVEATARLSRDRFSSFLSGWVRRIGAAVAQ